jgi:hypothetical protein
MVTSSTQNVLAILISFGGSDGLDTAGRHLSELLQKYAEGRDVHFEVIS